MGRGWEATNSEPQLAGWSRKRRVVVMRRPLEAGRAVPVQAAESDQFNLGFSEVVQSLDALWEYRVLVTSLECLNLTLAQLYRDRGDAENAFDELKNHWGWSGCGSSPTVLPSRRGIIIGRQKSVTFESKLTLQAAERHITDRDMSPDPLWGPVIDGPDLDDVDTPTPPSEVLHRKTGMEHMLTKQKNCRDPEAMA